MNTTDSAATRRHRPAASPAEALRRVLAAMAGPDAVPRADQVEAVDALVGGRRRVLLVQATGWGKSAVYWAATAARRAQGAGPTLVISPLLALMRDQVAAAERAGVAGRDGQLGQRRRLAARSSTPSSRDEVDVLLVSPERLANPRFADTARCPLLANAPGCWSSTRRTASPTGASTSGLTTSGSPGCWPR